MADTVVLHTDSLSKHYRHGVRAVDGLTISVEAGDVYGFLGLNGAGKTTTMRMLIGLVRPTAGTGSVLGRPLGDHSVLRRVGALVESPAFVPHLSGRDNLRLLARYARRSDDDVDDVLSVVHLTDRARSRFRTYSLGMRQRLGVAAALLGRPELLILDEPTNGLDPAGMADMRDLVRSIAGRGHTVMLSSHLLSEVEQVCNRVGIVHEGRLVAEGSLAEVQAAASTGTVVRVETDQVEQAVACLADVPGVGETTRGDGCVEVSAVSADTAEINRILVTAGVAVRHLEVRSRSLEDVFLGLTEDRDRSATEVAG